MTHEISKSELSVEADELRLWEAVFYGPGAPTSTYKNVTRYVQRMSGIWNATVAASGFKTFVESAALGQWTRGENSLAFILPEWYGIDLISRFNFLLKITLKKKQSPDPTMDIVARCNFPATLDSLLNSLEFVSACARAKGFSARRISEVRLAAEEALVNIFRYACPESPGEVEIICRFDSRERLVIELIDCGIPFDVLSVPEPKLTGGIEDRAVGGLGVHFMKTLMDGVHYSRKEGKNILTLFASREGRSRS